MKLQYGCKRMSLIHFNCETADTLEYITNKTFFNASLKDAFTCSSYLLFIYMGYSEQ
jgi:hypothetical protein